MEYLALIVILAVFGYVMHRQQRTIDRLTDKLMAKDYSEYKRHDRTVVREEPKTRKPQSFYDDASIETDEVH